MKPVEVKYEVVQLKGGLDLITPTLSLPPGAIRDGLNVECNTEGGYTRVTGYERFDGRPSPSAAVYTVLNVTGSTTPALGSTITGNTSAETAVLVAQDTTFFVLTKVSGAFTVGEDLKVSGSTVAVYASSGYATTAQLDAQYLALAADEYRDDIAAPTGSGPARGVCVYNDDVYAFRDNAGATACIMYKATTSGWEVVPFYYEIAFTAGGNVAPAESTTLTQGGVTATVKRVVRSSGAWVGTPGTAAGTLIISAPAGGNFASGAATITGGVNVTLTAVQTVISLLPGGKFDLCVTNFTGSSATTRLYGADGVNRAFEFDGSTFVPINTGMSPDTPVHVVSHTNRLFLTFGSSMLHSAAGLPYDYTSVGGASEIAVGEIITGLLVQPGAQTTGAMEVLTGSTTRMLYGTGTSTWNLVVYNTGTGGISWTAQNMSQSYCLDSRGVIGMIPAQAYGNFEQATLTAGIKPFIVTERSKTTCSTLCREKSQYRLFFNDGYALYLTIVNGKYLGAVPVLLPITGNGHSGLYQAWESVLTTGDAVVYGAGYDGYIYQFEKGTSFDGSDINWYLTLNYDSVRTPRLLKRFRRASLEIQGSSYAYVVFSYSLGYGNTDISQPGSATYESNFSPAVWDSMTWDSFVWDGRTLIPSECEMVGTGENVAIQLSGGGDYIASFTMNSLIIHYSPRRGLR